jgi:insertion element IS1 protein InsB
MWSFVKNSHNKQWIWLAIDRNSREIVGAHIGDRGEQSAKKLWESLPPVYRQCARIYTDFWAPYRAVLPSKRHFAVGKESGQTNHVERLRKR